MRYFVRVDSKKDVLYLYLVNHNTPALAAKWDEATLFRTKEEAMHGLSLIRNNFKDCGIISVEVRGVRLVMDDTVLAKEYF